MYEIEELLAGYAKFLEQDGELFKKLAKGQAPKTMVIACSDSRVDPVTIFGAQPGEIFVVRNVAALVPPYVENYDRHHGTSAAIEFAVRYLKVNKIIVIGHSECGGIKYLLNPKEELYESFIGPWVNIAEEAKEKAVKVSENPDERQHLCEKEAIKVSLKNLKSFTCVSTQIKREKLALHGWHFSIHDRRLEMLNQETGKFEIFDKKITHTDIKHVPNIRFSTRFPGMVALAVGISNSVVIAGGILYAQQKHHLRQPASRLNDPVLSTNHASELERRIECFR